MFSAYGNSQSSGRQQRAPYVFIYYGGSRVAYAVDAAGHFSDCRRHRQMAHSDDYVYNV